MTDKTRYQTRQRMIRLARSIAEDMQRERERNRHPQKHKRWRRSKEYYYDPTMDARVDEVFALALQFPPGDATPADVQRLIKSPSGTTIPDNLIPDNLIGYMAVKTVFISGARFGHGEFETPHLPAVFEMLRHLV